LTSGAFDRWTNMKELAMCDEHELPPSQPELPEPADGSGPVPMKNTSLWPSLLTGAVLLAASGGIIFVLSGGIVGRTRGASRSTQLKWEARAQEIHQVDRQARAESCAPDDLGHHSEK
jgi:hypothetical protein